MVLCKVYAILLLAGISSGLKDTCPANGASAYTFCVTLSNNRTGHRVVSVNIDREKSFYTKEQKETELYVTHSSSLCGNREKVELTATAIISGSGQNEKSRKDYEFFPGLGYYKLHTVGERWDDARIICHIEGAHLMVINSDAEAEVVKTYFSRNPNFQDVYLTYYVFIGFHDKFEEGHFVVVTGEPLESSGYARWAPGQPDGGTRQNFGGVDKDGRLHDIVDTEKYGFICEQNG